MLTSHMPGHDVEARLALFRSAGIALADAEVIAGERRTADDVRNALTSGAYGVRLSLIAWHRSLGEARRILDEAQRRDVRVLCTPDDEYPRWLRATTDRPPVLYVKGTLRPDDACVACVGTRTPTPFGEEVTKRIAMRLVELEPRLVIVSGLALGVDTIAHRAALAGNGRTVAVLANGLDTVYPRENAALAEAILGAGGALVSEQDFGAPAQARNLVLRDRIQSGLSLATIVMQTDLRGGTTHTVRFALSQQRLLFAAVPALDLPIEPASRGPVALTRHTGRELAMELQASGAYAALLRESFGDRPVARAIRGRDDYRAVLEGIEEQWRRGPRALPTAARRQVQLGLGGAISIAKEAVPARRAGRH